MKPSKDLKPNRRKNNLSKMRAKKNQNPRLHKTGRKKTKNKVHKEKTNDE